MFITVQPQPTIFLFPQPEQPSLCTRQSYFVKINVDTNVPSTQVATFPQVSPQNPLPHPFPPYLPKAPSPDIIPLHFATCTIHIMQLHTMQSAAVNCHRMLPGPNMFLSTLFLKTLSLCSSLIMRHKASYNIKQ